MMSNNNNSSIISNDVDSNNLERKAAHSSLASILPPPPALSHQTSSLADSLMNSSSSSSMLFPNTLDQSHHVTRSVVSASHAHGGMGGGIMRPPADPLLFRSAMTAHGFNSLSHSQSHPESFSFADLDFTSQLQPEMAGLSMMSDLEKPSNGISNISSMSMNFPLTNSASSPFTQSAYVPSIPEPPAITGGYLDPSYHQFSCSKPIKILQCLQTALSSLKIDYNVKAQKYKLKCVTYRGGERIPFIARVFTTANSSYAKTSTSYSIITSDVSKPVLESSSSTRYAIEIQRRSGCVIAFSEIYRSIIHHLEDNGIVVPEQPAGSEADRIAAEWTGNSNHGPAVNKNRSNFSLSCPPLNVDDASSNFSGASSSSSIEEARETLDCLIQMAASPCADIKAQAIAALSEMSRNADDQVLSMLIGDGGLATLIREVEHSFEDVHRNALSGIANLTCNNIEACRRVKLAGLQSLYGLSHSKTAQVIRECARALANIGLALGNDVIDHEFRGTLDKFCCSPDTVTRQHAHKLAERISIQ